VENRVDKANIRVLIAAGLSNAAAKEITRLDEKSLVSLSAVVTSICEDRKIMSNTEASLDISEADKEKLYAIKSPLVGFYYNSPCPGNTPLFIKVGDIIEPGHEVALIEAMKVFSPIPFDGPMPMKVVKIMVENGTLVHEGDDLVLLLPPEA